MRTRIGPRAGVASSPSPTSAPEPLIDEAPQVHIDHGAAVLKWAEGISEKALATLVSSSSAKEFKNDILIMAGDLGDTFNAIKSVPEAARAMNL